VSDLELLIGAVIVVAGVVSLNAALAELRRGAREEDVSEERSRKKAARARGEDALTRYVRLLEKENAELKAKAKDSAPRPALTTPLGQAEEGVENATGSMKETA
jgi:hypothetical protein